MAVYPTGSDPAPAGSLRPPWSAYLVSAVVLGLTGIGLLWVGLYARKGPTLDGIPFFYWYSMLWVILNAALQALAFRLVGRRRTEPGAGGGR
jgi:hypothetical protein